MTRNSPVVISNSIFPFPFFFFFFFFSFLLSPAGTS